jgi:hypothetical protein
MSIALSMQASPGVVPMRADRRCGAEVTGGVPDQAGRTAGGLNADWRR